MSSQSRAAVAVFLEYVRSAGAEQELVEWMDLELEQSMNQCHFCDEAMGATPMIDWINPESPTQPPLTDRSVLHVCCPTCWNFRRTVPYFVMIANALAFKRGTMRFCCGEFHANSLDRVRASQQFEEAHSQCRGCWEQTLRKRKTEDWQSYVRSWTNTKDPRNLHLQGIPTLEEVERHQRQKTEKEETNGREEGKVGMEE